MSPDIIQCEDMVLVYYWIWIWRGVGWEALVLKLASYWSLNLTTVFPSQYSWGGCMLYECNKELGGILLLPFPNQEKKSPVAVSLVEDFFPREVLATPPTRTSSYLLLTTFGDFFHPIQTFRTTDSLPPFPQPSGRTILKSLHRNLFLNITPYLPDRNSYPRDLRI